MDEFILNDDIKSFFTSMEELADIDDDLLDDESVTQLVNIMNDSLKGSTGRQAINQIINNLEIEGATRQDAEDAIKALKEYITNKVYGKQVLGGNKKKVIDAVISATYELFDEALAKYHMYSIELPMKLEDGAKVPTYAHDTDAAADLYALEDTGLSAHTYGNKIRTGVSIQLPEGWLALIIPRSSIGAKTPLRLSNSVGLIDSGYRGELGVLYDNTSDNEAFVKAGDRIAQLLVMPSYRFKAKVVDELTDSDRGTGGFGSSGT